MSTELSPSAREVIYKIRHVIKGEPLNDALALRHARALILRPVMGVSPEEEYDALVEALGSTVPLSTWQGDPGFERVLSESDFRDHLGRVVEKLDSMRPWPSPLFRALAPEGWSDYSAARPIGIFNLSVLEVEKRLSMHMVPMNRPASEGRIRVVLLSLRSGCEIAIVGRWWRDQPSMVAALTRDPDTSAEELMAELTSEGHFKTGEYSVISGM